MWSKKYNKCIVCGTTERKYGGKGMCKKCYYCEWKMTEGGKEYKEKNSEKVKEYRRKNSEKVKEYNKEYGKRNFGRLRERKRNYYKINFERISENSKNYYKINSEKIKENTKNYYRANFEKYKEYSKEYREQNFERLKEYTKLNHRYRHRNDSRYKLKCNISSLFGSRLKKRLSSKNGKSTFSFFSYTIEDLIQHLEKQFTEGMTWDNYGKWHIDHIRPDCSFNYKSVKDEEFQKCWALENLQPLWAIDNFSKGGRW
jgi:uncharacterized Zn finger protein (UPF0148 family)